MWPFNRQKKIYPYRIRLGKDYRKLNRAERRASGKKGYKYDVTKRQAIQTEITGYHIINDFFELQVCGLLIVKKGYKWDGPSGPTIDTPSFMRGSLWHDLGYQLMREGLIDHKHRQYFDLLLYRICKEDGMLHIRAEWVYYAVRSLGWKHIQAS